jgi:hypothetical protein
MVPVLTGPSETSSDQRQSQHRRYAASSVPHETYCSRDSLPATAATTKPSRLLFAGEFTVWIPSVDGDQGL